MSDPKTLLIQLEDWFTTGLEGIVGESFWDKWGDHDAADLDEAVRILSRLWCKYAGCTPERDQCNLPEHDYCLVCYDPMPGEAKR